MNPTHFSKKPQRLSEKKYNLILYSWVIIFALLSLGLSLTNPLLIWIDNLIFAILYSFISVAIFLIGLSCIGLLIRLKMSVEGKALAWQGWKFAMNDSKPLLLKLWWFLSWMWVWLIVAAHSLYVIWSHSSEFLYQKGELDIIFVMIVTTCLLILLLICTFIATFPIKIGEWVNEITR